MAKRASNSASHSAKNAAVKPSGKCGGVGYAAGPLATQLGELDCDPIAIMAGIAKDTSADLRLRFAVAKELAAYLFVKPGKIEVSSPGAVDVAGIVSSTWRHSELGRRGKTGAGVHKHPKEK